MKLKRILNLLLLATLSLFILSACSDDSGSDDTTSDRSNSISDTIGNGSGGNTGNTDGSNVDNTTVDGNDDNTTIDSEDDDTINGDREGTTDGSGDVTTTDDEEATDSESEDTETNNESVTDSESDEGNTEGEDSNTDTDGDGDITETEDETITYEPITEINNILTVKRLDIQYQDGNGNTINATSDYVGSKPSYYYNENNFAAYYNASTQILRIIGKIEIAWEEMTDYNNVKLNELRYKYFDDTIYVASDRLSEAFPRDDDGNITFTYPFTLLANDDDRITYKSSSSNKLVFTLTLDDSVDFPDDEESFKGRSRDMVPVNFSEDPYSLFGTYEAGVGCLVTSIGSDAGPYSITRDYVTFKNEYFKIYSSGDAEFSFYIYVNYQIGNDNNFYNGTFKTNWSKIAEWWGSESFDVYYNTGSYPTSDTTLTMTEVKDVVNKFSVSFTAKRNDSRYMYFSCYFEKISDKID